MKTKNIILAGAGTVVGAIALKAAFNFGAKMGVAYFLSELPSEDLSEILGKEETKWHKDIAKLIAIKKRRSK